MASTTLVERDIEDGKRLIIALERSGFSVQSALWFYGVEANKWTLYLASPTVDAEGPRSAYSRVQSTMSGLSPPLSFNLRDISLVRPKYDLIQLLKSAIQTGAGISGIRFAHNTINGIYIEDAYIYRLQ